jgi:hypothetical protein
MEYKLNYDLDYFKVDTPTSEKHDEIYMTGFGVDETGNVTVMPWRRIKSNTVDSFTEVEDRTDPSTADIVRGETIIGSPTLFSAKLPGRKKLRYQVWLWIVESDNAALLREKFNFNAESLESSIRSNFVYDLRRDGYPEETRVFQATSNNIMKIHADLQEALHSSGTKFQVFLPITKFVDCNFFINPTTSPIYNADLEQGEYNIDVELNSRIFEFFPSNYSLYGIDRVGQPSKYILSNKWRLIVSGIGGLPTRS